MYHLILICLMGDLPVPVPWEDLPKEVASLKARVDALEKGKVKTTREVPIFRSTEQCVYCPNIERTIKAANFDFVKELPIGDQIVPRVEWAGRYVEGNDPVSVLRLLNGDLTAGQPIATMQVSQPAVFRTPIRSGGPSWTWPGDLRHHLAGTHGHSAEELAGMSHADLVALHNSDHNGGFQGSSFIQSNNRTYGGGRNLFSPRIRLFGGKVRAGGGCPGGNCP